MKIKCKRCGIRGGSDLAFMWHSAETGGKVVWLCPDCLAEFDSDDERSRFLLGKHRKIGGK